MAWTRHSAGVRFKWVDGETLYTHTIPVHTLRIVPEPYSDSGTSVSTLFDGRRVMEPTTYGYRLEFEWPWLHPAEQAELYTILNRFTVQGAADEVFVDLDGETEDPTKVLTNVIVDMAASDLEAVFDARLRRRPASLTCLTASQKLSRITWLHL